MRQKKGWLVVLRRLLSAVLAVLSWTASGPSSAARADFSPASGYLKGQLHLHTSRSADSNVSPTDVVAFYERRGYDFIVVTDHNHVTVVPGSPRMLVLAGVELTRNTRSCDPPPERGKCLVHVNALFVKAADGAAPLPRTRGSDRLDLYLQHLQTTTELGGLAMLNHPNFRWTVTPEVATGLAAAGLRLLEVANQGMRHCNAGDATHPSTEALWDLVLSAGFDVWGVATDDAHHYETSAALRRAGRRAGIYPGDLGWIMVRSERDPAAIRAAVERGDFYASTGILLHDLRVIDGALEVVVAGQGPFRVEFIGHGGRLLASHDGRAGRIALARAAGGYVRARVRGPGGAMAWTQPVRWPSSSRRWVVALEDLVRRLIRAPKR